MTKQSKPTPIDTPNTNSVNEQKLTEEQVKTNVFTQLSKSCFKIARTYLKRELIAQVLQFIFS
jgi:hypothetical protein